MLRFLVFPGLILFFLSACGGSSNDTENPQLSSEAQLKEGEVLAQKYCGNCHAVPAPDLLNRSTWENSVLPRMGYMMGFYPSDAPDQRYNLIEPGYAGTLVENAGVFPKKAILEEEAWKKIEAYYLKNAPSEIEGAPVQDIEEGLKHFKVNIPDHYLSPPSTTLVHINANKSFFIGDAQTQQLYVFDDKMELLGRANVKEGAVSLQEVPNAYLITSMGSFSPTDAPSGLLMALPKAPNQQPKIILDSLQRPVHTSFADFNGDGKEDILTCEFAKWTGKLTWWESRELGQAPIPHILRQKPGAIKAYPVDINNDKLFDIIALFGQGDEGIFIYHNEGGGKFREEKVISFPSSYGSSYMQIFDFNRDGYWD
ncbi:MAG: VCBS repeat-containing protein, partial [Bacteroidota bacterium]